MAGADKDEFNLNVLRRKDPDVEQILGDSKHVTMYVMSVDAQKWERGNVEGTLFVLKRRSNPRFQLMVLNKLSTENYVETVESGFHAEVQPPYLIYTQGGGKVHALWFYEEADLHKMAALLLKVEAGLPKPPVPPADATQKHQPANGASNDDGDGAFWDKPPKPKQPEDAGKAAEAPTNAVINLLSKMQVKQQHEALRQTAEDAARYQQVAAAALQEAQGAAGSSSTAPVPLPPSFFQQAQAGPGGPALPPLPEAWQVKSQGPAAPAAPPAPAAPATTQPQEVSSNNANAITKLFNKAAAAPPPPAPTQAAAPGKPNALAQLFTNAVNRPAWQVQAQFGIPAPGTPGTPARGDAATSREAEEKLKLALKRLVQRDAFVQLLLEELRAVGLGF